MHDMCICESCAEEYRIGDIVGRTVAEVTAPIFSEVASIKETVSDIAEHYDDDDKDDDDKDDDDKDDDDKDDDDNEDKEEDDKDEGGDTEVEVIEPPAKDDASEDSAPSKTRKRGPFRRN